MSDDFLNQIFEKTSLEDVFKVYLDYILYHIYTAVYQYLLAKYSLNISYVSTDYFTPLFAQFLHQRLSEESNLIERQIQQLQILKITMLEQEIERLNIVRSLKIQVQYYVEYIQTNKFTRLSNHYREDKNIVLLLTNFKGRLLIDNVIKDV